MYNLSKVDIMLKLDYNIYWRVIKMNEDSMKTKYELVVERIKQLEEGLVFDYDSRWADKRIRFDAEYVIGQYVEIRDSLENIPGLTSEEKAKLRELLDIKIAEAPEKYKQATEEHENYESNIDNKREEVAELWEEAKERYANASIFQKIKHTIQRTRPKDLEINSHYPHLSDPKGVLGQNDFEDDYKHMKTNISRLYGGDYDR